MLPVPLSTAALKSIGIGYPDSEIKNLTRTWDLLIIRPTQGRAPQTGMLVMFTANDSCDVSLIRRGRVVPSSQVGSSGCARNLVGDA